MTAPGDDGRNPSHASRLENGMGDAVEKVIAEATQETVEDAQDPATEATPASVATTGGHNVPEEELIAIPGDKGGNPTHADRLPDGPGDAVEKAIAEDALLPTEDAQDPAMDIISKYPLES